MIKSTGAVAGGSPRGWVRSSRCAANSNCMEVHHGKTSVGVRDSKRPDLESLAFTRPQWTDFLRMIAR